MQVSPRFAAQSFTPMVSPPAVAAPDADTVQFAGKRAPAREERIAVAGIGLATGILSTITFLWALMYNDMHSSHCESPDTIAAASACGEIKGNRDGYLGAAIPSGLGALFSVGAYRHLRRREEAEVEQAAQQNKSPQEEQDAS